MYQIIQPIHSYLAYLTLFLLAFATLNGMMGSSSQKAFEEKHLRINKFALIATHTMFLLGVILLFTSPITQAAFADMKATMKDPYYRLYAVEHPTINLLAVILVTIGNARVKRAVGNGKKFKQTMIFFGLALVLLLTRIPWSAWLGLN
ncbi:hypothetical protein [Emticicia agri]|uniref:Cytochrome B n=2 Tax=Emticicia agri TaxID=2492393 RepID=A0A4Q5LNH6_9BACT|nr:hypothetical protein [Emticicia agri]RYU90419.1 hypothetical protein EWM59_27390 [Emticicia agri]RYU91855.1 hypothetical protein EWM59_26390 [Emticicia agri]